MAFLSDEGYTFNKLFVSSGEGVLVVFVRILGTEFPSGVNIVIFPVKVVHIKFIVDSMAEDNNFIEAYVQHLINLVLIGCFRK